MQVKRRTVPGGGGLRLLEPVRIIGRLHDRPGVWVVCWLLEHDNVIGHEEEVGRVAKANPGLARGDRVVEVPVCDGLLVLLKIEDRIVAVGLGADLFDHGGGPTRRADIDLRRSVAVSIKDRGLLQPILVRPVGKNRYQIVAGERRWRAAQTAGLHEVPVVVRDLEDDETLQLGIIENVQREDLNPIEEARGYQRLSQDFGHSAEAIAGLVGKSRSHVANLVRLLGLPDEVQALVGEGALSMGHARALIGAKDPLTLAKQVIADGLSVRETESLAGAAKGKQKREPRPGGLGRRKDADTEALERELSAALSAPVSITHSADGTGTLTIKYKDLEHLDAVCAQLGMS